MRWMPSLMRGAFQLIWTPSILAHALYGLQPLNREYDAQPIPGPSNYPIAWQPNETEFIFFAVLVVFVV